MFMAAVQHAMASNLAMDRHNVPCSTLIEQWKGGDEEDSQRGTKRGSIMVILS
jgi:hypothetical protein